MVSIVIDAPERIVAAFDIVDSLTTEQGLVTSETVPACARGRREPYRAPSRRGMSL